MKRQSTFLSRVRSALGVSEDDGRTFGEIFAPGNTGPQKALVETVDKRSHRQRMGLLHTLEVIGKPLNLNIIPVANTSGAAAAIGNLVATKHPEWGPAKSVAAWPHPLIEQLDLAAALSDQDVPVFSSDLEVATRKTAPDKTDIEKIRKRITESFMGVTAADYCLAETATLVLRTRPGQARSVSLLPSIHVAVITLEQIIADLQELYAILNQENEDHSDDLTNCMSLITGPSKTADIELTMVHGAHGPRELHIIVIGADRV